MTQVNVDKKGFLVDYNRGGEGFPDIENVTYGEYLYEFHSDQICSPNGVCPRLFIEKEMDEDGSIIYVVKDWVTSSNSRPRVVDQFNTDEEAMQFRFQCWEENRNGNYTAPRFFESFDEVIEDIAESKNKPVEIIRRWVSFCQHIIKAEEERQRAYYRDLQEKVKAIAAKARETAESLAIDDQFRYSLSIAEGMSGKAKSDFLAASFTSLLERNGIKKLDADFWQTMRMTKARAEKN